MHVRFLPVLPLHPVVVKSDTKLLALQAFLEHVFKATQFSQNLNVMHIYAEKGCWLSKSVLQL